MVSMRSSAGMSESNEAQRRNRGILTVVKFRRSADIRREPGNAKKKTAEAYACGG